MASSGPRQPAPGADTQTSATTSEPPANTTNKTSSLPLSRGLHNKLAEVMAEVDRVPKNGTAPREMGGFKFVQVGDAADAIRGALGSRGVSMLPTAIDVIGEREHETKSGGVMTTMTIRTTWTLTDGDTGETAIIQSFGTGADRGDKFAPKAQTNAMKYALLMGFLMSTGDDPEMSDTSDRQRRASTVTIGASSVPDVAPGGRTAKASPAQLQQISVRSQELNLGSDGLAAVIKMALGDDLALEGSDDDRRRALVFYLKASSSEDAAKIIEFLSDVERVGTAAPSADATY